MKKFFICSLILILPSINFGQDRLRQSKQYENYSKMRIEYGSAVKRNDISGVAWDESGKFVFYRIGNTGYRFDFQKRSSAPGEPPATNSTTNQAGRPIGSPARGRQFVEAISPNGIWKINYRDRNLFLTNTKSNEIAQITFDGNELARTKCGNASWVYGEELGVREAFWFSPDSTKIAYYKFDESKVSDYFLTPNSLQIQNELDVEAYPKAGTPNPQVELFVYDINSKSVKKIDVRNGREFDNGVGHYVYSVRWSPNGDELLFNRTNRKQNVMEFCAANPNNGSVRVIITEEWQNSWVENSPEIRFLKDKNRFIWASERTGFRNYYLYDLSGKLLNPLTRQNSDCNQIARITNDEKNIFYSSRTGDNPYLVQFHKVSIDGKDDKKLTDSSFTHSLNASPDGKWFVDTFENHNTPPTSVFRSVKGDLVAKLSESDVKNVKDRKLETVELFTFVAADGKTVLYGLLHKPSNFNPYKSYPLIVDVYGGPESGTISERYSVSNSLVEYGVLVAEFDGRGTNGRGKLFKDAIYQKLGVVEIDDQAAGVEFLKKRPYVDASKIGIYGSSYGGYASAMAILRHPKTFTAAVASSSVTDWRNYDTIYTERYMWTPQENQKGYEAGSCMTYASNLSGKLLLFFGTADNNVHPSNSYQLIRALQRAGKSYDLQLGPDLGHSGISGEVMMQYFLESFKVLD